jgi:hypothetical protein
VLLTVAAAGRPRGAVPGGRPAFPVAGRIWRLAFDVADEIRQSVDARERGEIPEPDGALFGKVGGYALDFYGSWERVAVGFDVAAVNGSGSGVPL